MGASRPPVTTRTAGDPDEIDGELDEELAELERVEPADPDGPAPSLVVFDIGEVLIDESRVWHCWADILGVSRLELAAVLGAAIAQGGDYADAFAHVAPNVDWEDFLDEHERRYGGFTADDVYPDVRLCIDELRELGFTVALAGNQPATRREQLQALELGVEQIVTSEELGVAKPDPAFFDEVMRLVGASDPADVCYVGDRVDNDVIPALRHGLRACWLQRGPWGVLQELPDDLQADLVLDGLGELPLLLDEWRRG